MDNKTLMLESLKAAYSFLDGAEKILNMKRGEGYAAEHPELAGLFMLTAALDFHGRAAASLAGKESGHE